MDRESIDRAGSKFRVNEFEWAIRVEKAVDLRCFPAQLGGNGIEPRSHWEELRQELNNLLVSQFGPQALTRLYFGSEFCQLLISGLKELQQAWSIARERSMDFTLVTPFVTEDGLGRLRPLFEFLQVQREEAEVVANDWGVLCWLQRDYPRLRPVMGRLLFKALRDPRLVTPESLAHYSGRGRAFIAGSSITEGHYVQLLRNLGVTLVSLDNLVPDGPIDVSGTALSGSLHLPFSHVATGRLCLLGSLHLPKPKKFQEMEHCGHECRDYVLELKHETVSMRLFQRGNTVVSLHTPQMISDVPERAVALGIRRMVYEWA